MFIDNLKMKCQTCKEEIEPPPKVEVLVRDGIEEYHGSLPKAIKYNFCSDKCFYEFLKSIIPPTVN